MKRIITLLLLVFASFLAAEYPAGYFFAIFDGDTFCVEPVITDSVIESEWFDYGSASLHTGLEVPYESHVLFFYNPLTGNIGFLIQHNIDEIGTEDATCAGYLDYLPSPCSLAISDDYHEFRLTRYPQGQWHWWYNTDGGAFFIPRGEWKFRYMTGFGSYDPIKRFSFISGHEGGTNILLDSVTVEVPETLWVGHGFLQLLPYPDDTLWFDDFPMYTDSVLSFLVRNSGETVDTLNCTGGDHTNPNFTTVSTPGVMPPSDGGAFEFHFAGGGPGLYVDTLWPHTNEPCGTNPIFINVRILPPALGHIAVQEEGEISYLRVIDSTYAEAAANGIMMVRLPGETGAADLVDTTDISASGVLVKTPYGIKSWRKGTPH